MNRLLLSLLVTIALPLGCVGANPYDATEQVASKACAIPEDAARLADQVLQLVNLERAGVGQAPVSLDSTLSKVAGDYACNMIDGDFFGHTEPETDFGPGERAVKARYTFFAVGENLAAGQQTAAEVMQEWMNSPAHREIILDPAWKEIGIGVRTGGRYGIYWVQEFGEPTDY